MTFTFTQARELKPQQVNPLSGLIEKALQGYGQGMQLKYMPRQMEADIFHKQIAPLAMLASSPYFSSLHPQQQQQIAGYISQMLSKQGLSGGQGISGGQGAGGGAGNAASAGGGGYSGPLVEGETGEALSPGGPAEHFTSKFTESPFTSGTPHTSKTGDVVYTPTGANVQQGIDVLTESKGLQNLFNQYAEIAPKVAKKGPLAGVAGTVSSNLSKLGIPGIKTGASYLGISELPNQSAKMDSLRAQMSPALRALRFTNDEINSIFAIHPGENEKNVEDRLKKTWPVIERKIKNYRKNLYQGVSVNESSGKENPITTAINNHETNDAAVNHTAKYFNVSPDVVKEAQTMGVKTAKEFRDFLRWRNEGQ